MELENINELPVNLTSNSLKAFRRYSDIEDFYRFVYENDIRNEAAHMLTTFMAQKKAKKAEK